MQQSCLRHSIGELALTAQVTATQAKILKELLVDGRKTENEIAKKLHLTKEAVKRNYHKLEENGIIAGATIHINYKDFGYKAVAHILINLDPCQADEFVKYLQKMPEIYGFYNREVKGNMDVIVILKSFEHLNEIKDSFKSNFAIFEMKTAIWTDVKEMNYNLAIIPDNSTIKEASKQEIQTKERETLPKTLTIDEIDQKIADKLAINGRISMDNLSKEIGVSPDIAKRRYKKLKDNGVLKVTIQINPINLGYQAICVFFTTTSHEKPDLIIEKVSEIPNVISIMKTAGDYDLQIYALVQDIGQLLYIQEQIGKTPGISKIDPEISRIREELKKWPSPRQYISTF